MTKKERLEDLGIIKEKLAQVILDYESDWEQLFRSKYDLDDFVDALKNENGPNDFNTFLRFFRNHIEKIEEIYFVANGDPE